MPLYSYECQKCNVEFDQVLPLSKCDSIQNCPLCKTAAKKIIPLGHGGIRRTGDGVQWVRDASKVLCEGTNQKLETVQDYRSFLARNPKVRPKEDHPCIPSSMGDYLYEKPDPKQINRERSRKGHELIREMRKITVNS